MTDEQKLAVNMAAAELVRPTENITDICEPDWRILDIFGGPAFCLAVVKKLGEKQISIRASDSGKSWAYYDERNHSWSIGYHTYEEAIDAAVLEICNATEK